MPFGHIEWIDRHGDDVVVRLKNNVEIEVQPSNTDLGRGMRSLIVDDPQHGEMDIDWRSLDRVEFSAGPGAGRDSERLYGTVVTNDESISGYIVWDMDESLLEDIIDGDDGNRDRKIPFRDIHQIERRCAWRAGTSGSSAPCRIVTAQPR